jgi:hypothetical protein
LLALTILWSVRIRDLGFFYASTAGDDSILEEGAGAIGQAWSMFGATIAVDRHLDVLFTNSFTAKM